MEDLGFDAHGADFGVGLFTEGVGQAAAPVGVDAGFEGRNAGEPPFGVGDGLGEGLFVVCDRLVPGEETGDVFEVDLTVVLRKKDGAAGEAGFHGVV